MLKVVFFFYLLLFSKPLLSEEKKPENPFNLPPELSQFTVESSDEPEIKQDELSFEQIVNPEIITATNMPENSLDAPAWVITLTGRELKERGYKSLMNILKDLPGMDFIKPLGDHYFKNYWRGYRNTIGSPFLFMVDSMPMNNLYYNVTEVMAVLPLSNIKKVEIVYGPDSVVYGSNAFMGVINVITKKDRESYGSDFISSFSLSAPQNNLSYVNKMNKNLEAYFLFKDEKFRLSFTGRFESGIIDPSLGENAEWTKEKYYQDPKLWGPFSGDNYPEISGNGKSPHNITALDFRVFFGETMLGFTRYKLNRGYGFVYSADQIQRNAKWILISQNAFLVHKKQFHKNFSSKSIFRYRRNDVPSDSFDLSNSCTEGSFKEGCKNIKSQALYWKALNNSISLDQEFIFKIGRNIIADKDALLVSSGFTYQKKYLQKAYEFQKSGLWPANSDAFEAAKTTKNFWNNPENGESSQNNKSEIEHKAVFVQARYDLWDKHLLNFGFRYSHNSFYKGFKTLSTGYVLKEAPFTFKVLYGESFQEPSQRLLFGSWSGLGSNPNLMPEKSNTLELSVNYMTNIYAVQANGYWIRNKNTLVTFKGSAGNLGDRVVVGSDFMAQALIPNSGLRRLNAWAYFSWIIQAEEKVPSPEDKAILLREDIGDLAKYKLWLGATAEFNRYFSATVLARKIWQRETVESNPIDSIPGFQIIDLNFLLEDFYVDGLGLALKVENLLDEKYFHPGVMQADSGEIPGKFDADGAWLGSKGIFNSKLPQPGRTISLTLFIDY